MFDKAATSEWIGAQCKPQCLGRTVCDEDAMVGCVDVVAGFHEDAVYGCGAENSPANHPTRSIVKALSQPCYIILQ